MAVGAAAVINNTAMQAKFRFISLLILISVWIQPALSQNYLNSGKNDLEKENLKGRILSIHQYVYDATMKFGDEYKGYLKDEYIVQYNKNGDIRKTIDLYPYPDTCIYLYNDKNQLIETNSNTTNITYLYDNVGRLAEVNEYEYIGGVKEFQFKTKYKYTPTEIDVTKYDYKGWPIRRERISGNEKIGPRPYNKQYFNSEGKLIKETGSDMQLGVFIKEYFYNKNGDITSVSTIYTEYFTEKKFSTYKYKYDKYGNWSEKKQYDDCDKSLTGDWIEREIVYAESEKDFDTIIAAEKEAETQKHKTYTYEEVTEKPTFRGGDLNDFEKLLTEEFERNRYLILTNYRTHNGPATIIPSKVKFIVDYEGKIKDTSLELLADETASKNQDSNIAYSLISLISDIENPQIRNPNQHERQWTPGKMNGFNTNTLCQLYIMPKNHGSSIYSSDGHSIRTTQDFLIMNNHEYEMYEKVKLRRQQVRDSINRRQQFVRDSLSQVRKKAYRDSIAAVERQKKAIKDYFCSLCENRFTSGAPLKNISGTINDVTFINNSFSFRSGRKVVISDIKFECMTNFNFGVDAEYKGTAIYDKDKNGIVVFFSEKYGDEKYQTIGVFRKDSDSGNYNLYELSKKCQKIFRGYYFANRIEHELEEL